MLLSRNLPFKRIIRGIVLLPFVIPTALSTLAWLWMFDSLYSVVNWTAIRLHLINAPGPNWLGQSDYAMAAVIAVNVWRGLPFFAITVLAGLMAVPKEFHEAAEVDGASSWGRFWHITLPLIKPVLGVVILFSTIFTFGDFNIVQVLTRGGPINTTHLFATLAYQVGLQGGNLGQGAAISLFIFPLLGHGGLLPAPLRQERVAVATARSRGARIRSNVFAYANLAPYVFFVLFPFYFMIVTSFKSNAELYNLKSIPFWIQTGAIMDHYALLFQKTDFVTWMKNSLLVAVVATTVSVIISILAGYSLARLRFRGAAAFGTAIFITYLIPTTLLFLPLSQVVVWLGLADSIYALMVIYPTFLVPFCTWLLMGYFRTIPREVEECALVDGATRMQTLSKIVLPMAIPGVICAVLFSFTLCWNEFTYALTFISQSANKTAVVGVTSDLIRGDIYFWGSLMAGALLASIPIVIVYVLFLDYYVSGLTAGAVKG